MTPKIDARNGCYGNEEATADDGAYEFGRCGESAESELNQADTVPLGSGMGAPSLSNEQWPNLAGSPSLPAGRNGALVGATAEAPKYDGNLLPAMPAMVTGFVDKLTCTYACRPTEDQHTALCVNRRAEQRAKLFRETTRSLLPEFAHLIKHEGGRNEIE